MSPLYVALITVASAIIAALAAYLGHVLSRRSTRESNITADWTAFAEAQKIATENLRDTVLRQGADVVNLGERINRLEQKLRDEQKRFREAIAFIRELLRWIGHYVPGQDPPSVPDTLKEDV